MLAHLPIHCSFLRLLLLPAYCSDADAAWAAVLVMPKCAYQILGHTLLDLSQQLHSWKYWQFLAHYKIKKFYKFWAQKR